MSYPHTVRLCDANKVPIGQGTGMKVRHIYCTAIYPRRVGGTLTFQHSSLAGRSRGERWGEK